METVPAESAARETPQGTAPEDVLRADTYALLATLLRHEPDNDLLDIISSAEADHTEFGQAIGDLAAAAAVHPADAVAEEFHILFIGIGESELKPYASYYLTGFMHEKPLAKVRAALADLGIAKSDETVEPEDHIAALCEAMCAMIMGEFGAPASIADQKAFFNTHIRPWATHCFEDLERTPSASFYRPVGTLGRLFMQIETQSFEMEA
jgi:TorA maturation chaperone TorD